MFRVRTVHMTTDDSGKVAQETRTGRAGNVNGNEPNINRVRMIKSTFVVYGTKYKYVKNYRVQYGQTAIFHGYVERLQNQRRTYVRRMYYTVYTFHYYTSTVDVLEKRGILMRARSSCV